MISAAAAATA
jgi:hypothetical protein